jgi:hypothetical protein
MQNISLLWFFAMIAHCASVSLLQVKTENPKGERREYIAQKITVAPEVNQSLIVCNGYAYKEPISIFLSRGELLITPQPLAYKGCEEVHVPLMESDQLVFKAGQLPIGTFYTNRLPKYSSSLLLVPSRRDENSMAVTFQSHVFSDLDSPQAVVVDAYKGNDDSSLVHIEDVEDPTAAKASSLAERARPREEILKYKSIVALKPGMYKVGLVAQDQRTQVSELTQVAVSGKSRYVVARVGVGSREKSKYPQELIVFAQQRSFGFTLGCPWLAGLLAVSVALLTC